MYPYLQIIVCVFCRHWTASAEFDTWIMRRMVEEILAGSWPLMLWGRFIEFFMTFLSRCLSFWPRTSKAPTVWFLQSRTTSWGAGKTKRRTLVCAKSRGRAFLEMETSCVQALSKDYGFLRNLPMKLGPLKQASRQARKRKTQKIDWVAGWRQTVPGLHNPWVVETFSWNAEKPWKGDKMRRTQSNFCF